jgi:hypothetical protein
MAQNLSHQSEMHGLSEFHFIRLTAELISKRRGYSRTLSSSSKISAASSPGRKLLFVCRPIGADGSAITSKPKVSISSWRFCRPTHSNSIRSNTYGRIGSSMRCPTSVQGTLWSTLLVAAFWKQA